MAFGDDISLWQWDFNYDESKGFSAEVLKDESYKKSAIKRSF